MKEGTSGHDAAGAYWLTKVLARLADTEARACIDDIPVVSKGGNSSALVRAHIKGVCSEACALYKEKIAAATSTKARHLNVDDDDESTKMVLAMNYRQVRRLYFRRGSHARLVPELKAHWHHLSSSPNLPPCCGHAMASLWRVHVSKVQVFRRTATGGVVSVQLAALLSAICRSTGGRFGHPCHLAELRGQATDGSCLFWRWVSPYWRLLVRRRRRQFAGVI
jgi:hypothetical protein